MTTRMIRDGVELKRIVFPADVGFSHGMAWYSKAIRWCSRQPGEEATYANHTFGVGPKGDNIVEALATVKATPIEKWFDTASKEWAIYRRKELPWETRVKIANYAESKIGAVYGSVKIVPHLVDSLLTKLWGKNVKLFRRLCFLEEYPICSWLWGWAYAEQALKLSKTNPRYAQPDDQHDYIEATPAEYRLVARKLPSGVVYAFNETLGVQNA